MASILYLVPGVGLSVEELKRRERVANSFLTQDKNKVVVEAVDEGPLSIESSIEEAMSIGGMLKKLVAVQGRYDAMVIGCAGDPGLAPARELARIPVVGPIEASFHTAALLGEKFSMVTILDSIVPAIWRVLREYGLEHKCASVRVIDYPVLEMHKDPDGVAKALLRESQEAVLRDGAASIVMGCMSMAFMLVDERLKGQLDAPIVNPAKVAIKTAEMLVALGLSQSRITYPKPNYEKLGRSVFPNLKSGGQA
jgi:allantoin racemase